MADSVATACRRAICLRLVGAAVALYAIFHNKLPHYWPDEPLMDSLINGWVRGILIFMLIALFHALPRLSSSLGVALSSHHPGHQALCFAGLFRPELPDARILFGQSSRF